MKQPTISSLQKEIDAIKLRNQRVEQEKAWETSWIRKLSIAILTYLVVSIFFITIKVDKPLVNAVIPTFCFILSTMSLSSIKKWWQNK